MKTTELTKASDRKEIIERIVTFLDSINIQVVKTKMPCKTFLPGLDIKGQTILMDIEKFKYPGDLLHEAGHIAVTEATIRPYIGTDIIGYDWPNPGDEMAAILWSFAACCHLDIDLEVVFHPDGYKNDSHWLIEQFYSKNYIGLPLLEWMALCTSEEFPIMRKWLR